MAENKENINPTSSNPSAEAAKFDADSKKSSDTSQIKNATKSNELKESNEELSEAQRTEKAVLKAEKLRKKKEKRALFQLVHMGRYNQPSQNFYFERD